ncbi:type IV secretory system conjugative DNA transfer family protein [Lachnospiraceae bacterium WCA-9-b2]|uniref:Type IV secretory system conjugative DNA transfer family protein n=1 Tax=Sporofaciens musculi TaxID=2681861 RepID=A0A7X3MLS0_9FIRM|nr:type IV secretory system conjugative DNA transfer family protein [Sporofaciens musculi]MXP78620.1 type IV secretory system conjugative DNA transfer family protein [Sporofaciens musculi]
MMFWFFSKIAEGYRLSAGADAVTKMMAAVSGLGATITENPLPGFHPRDLLIGVAGAAAVRAVVYLKGKNAKKYRHGVEYGSARWGTQEDIKPFIDPKFPDNILLTQTERIMLGRNKIPKYNINKNVLIIGGSGSGKTRFHVKPNLMQMNASYVVTDPKGTVVLECGKMLQRGGYEIKILNTINFKESMKYNPFRYIRSENDILKLVNCIMENTKGEDSKGGEDFWAKAEALYYQALIAYIWYEAPEDEKNINTLLEMLNASEVREEDETFKNAVDMMFDRLEQRDPEHFAVRQYKKYKMAAGKTAKSILISCGARMAPFDIKEVRDMMMDDELELDKLGDRKTALFCIVSDTDTTFNFIASMVYTQMFNTLCDKALENGGALKTHVTCLLDEFANQKIPNFEHLISVIRSREISAHVIVQTQSQLKAVYKDHAETIIGNCSCVLFLGGKEQSTLKEISAMLGKETIDTFNTSDTRGSQRSYGLNYQKLGKELMTPDELAVMDGGKCILQVQGVRPFFSDKFDITKHPQYKYLSDADPKNTFDVAKFVKRRLKVKPEDKFEVCELEAPADPGSPAA